jgi:membrane-bound ClpP family serine protease
MMQNAWEQAFALMAHHGQMGACKIVASGMQKTPSGQPEQYRQWEVLADCLKAVAAASRTSH